MKLNRDSIGKLADHVMRFIAIAMLLSSFAIAYIREHLAKDATSTDLMLYAFIVGAILAALIYGSILAGIAIHAAWKRNRVKVVTHIGNKQYGTSIVVSSERAIQLMIERLVEACGKECMCISPLELRMFRFSLFQTSTMSLGVKTGTMTFFAEPDVITRIFDAFRARLMEGDMEALRPPSLRWK